MIYELLAQPAVQPAMQIQSPQGSWLGNVSAAGFGAGLLVVSHILASRQKLLWGPRIGAMLDNSLKGFDWKSLLSWLIGFAGITSILGSTGFLADAAQKIQSVVLWSQNIKVISSLGMAVICAIAVVKVFSDKNDSVKDIKWGVGCGLLFPLGGGIWSSFSVQVAEAIVGIMNGTTS